jgi:hypothetical protein
VFSSPQISQWGVGGIVSGDKGMRELVQKRPGLLRKYIIDKNGVEVEIKGYRTYTNRLVKFEEIGTDISIAGSTNNVWLIWFFISLCVNLFLVFHILKVEMRMTDEQYWIIQSSLFFLAIVAFVQIFREDREKRLHGEQIYLPFIYSKKTKHEVDVFIQTILSVRRSYYREKFMNLDRNLDDMMHKMNLRWLLNSEMISDEEYNELMTELENRRIIRGD